MNLTHAIADLEATPESDTITQYGIAYWNGQELLVDVFPTEDIRDKNMRHSVFNHGADNVRAVERTVTVTPATGWTDPAANGDCDVCGTSGPVTNYRDDRDRTGDEEMVYLFCKDCAEKPHNKAHLTVAA